MFKVSPDEFDRLVAEAVQDLPSRYLDRVRDSNLDIVVENRPSPRKLRELGMTPHDSLLGLYEGVSLPERERYGEVVPDKITIFQEPIESSVHSQAGLVRQISTTVRHEVAHLFGFDDDEIDEMGLG